MAKKKSLSAALKESARPATPEQNEPSRTGTGGGGRTGKKAIAGFFDPGVSRQLRSIGVQHDRTVQQLLAEALNDLFQKYGVSRIA